MKKIKEFIKKIGNKKRCLLSLIIAGLLIFAVISGLNSPKSAVTEVNAISAPTTKNLDLNGVRYTYTTSLLELKNKYNLFNNDFSRQFCTIVSNTESENILLLSAFSNDYNSFDEFDTQNENIAQTLNRNLVFIDEKGVKSTYSNSFSNNWNTETNRPSWDRPSYDFTEDNIGSLDDYASLNINFVNLINDFKTYTVNFRKENYNGNLMISFYYLNEDRDYNNDNEEYLYNNSKRFNYVLSKPINDFNIEIKKIDGYDLKNIVISFENNTQTNPLGIFGRVLDTYEEFKPNGMTANGNIVINNVKFVKSNQANIITFYSDFTYDETEKDTYFKGNLLLSNEKYDHEFIDKIWRYPNTTGRVNLNGAGFFGGKFNDNFPTGSELVFKRAGSGNAQYAFFVWVETNVLNINYSKNIFTSPNFGITYFNQSRLLYIENISPLNGTISGDDKTYNGLSAQVEDILYNVNYVGNIEEEEFKQKVEKDLADLLKTTGLGAVTGLLGGFLVGNPVGGLIVGAAIGFFSSISPLLIDGLQAIFGKDFLSGLYNFFDKISNFFVGIFDGIVNFLMSIITNPFILILIVMIALLYIFVLRKK